MTTLFWDQFQEAATTLITASTPETGTGWTEIYNTASSAVIQVKPSGKSGATHVAGPSTSENSVGAAYAISPAPGAADVRLEFDRYMLNWSVSNSYGTGVFARHSESGGNHTFYALLMVPNLHAEDSLRLYKVVAGTATLLGSYDHTFANGDEIAFECYDAAKKVYANGAEVISSADNAITGAGNAGVWWGMFTNAMGSYHLRAEVEYGDFFVSEAGSGGSVALAGSSGGAAFASGVLSVSGGSAPPTPAGPFDRDLALRVRVDWNRDGEMTGAYDDVSARVTEAEWSLGMYMPYQEMADEARLEMTLVNADRLFTPEYASGPLYGLLAPGAPVLVEMVDGAGNAYTMWRGWVEVIQPSWTPGGDAAPLYARLVALGGMQHLKASAVHLDLLQNVRTDQALASIFSSVSFPPKLVGSWRLGVAGASELGVTTRLTDAGGEYAFDRGRVTLSYVGDNWEDADAHGAILDLVRAERGRFFFARDGRAIFWNRARLQTSTIPALRLVQYQALEYVYGADLYNVVRVRVSPRTLSVTATEVLYELDEPITLRAGQTRTLRASYRQADSDAMVAGMDITPPNTGDGSLAYSGNLSVAFEAGATSAEITLMNLDGESNKLSDEATLTALIVRGRKLTSYGYQDAQATDTASVVAYGKRMMEVDARLLDRVEDAETIADWELALHKSPRGQVYAAQLTNRDATAREAQVKLTVGDRLTIAGPQVSHSGDYFVIGETHRVAAGSKHHKTTWRLEPAAPYAGWQLGVAGYSELGSATRLGF